MSISASAAEIRGENEIRTHRHRPRPRSGTDRVAAVAGIVTKLSGIVDVVRAPTRAKFRDDSSIGCETAGQKRSSGNGDRGRRSLRAELFRILQTLGHSRLRKPSSPISFLDLGFGPAVPRPIEISPPNSRRLSRDRMPTRPPNFESISASAAEIRSPREIRTHRHRLLSALATPQPLKLSLRNFQGL